MNPGGEGEPKSLEELKAAQEAHSAEVQAQRSQEEEEARLQKELEDQAKEDYAEGGRQDVLDEIKQARQEADQMEAEEIRERKSQAERIRGEIVDRKQSLELLKTQVAAAGERIKAISDIIKDVPEDEVAPAVKQSFEEAQKEHSGLLTQSQNITREVSQLEEKIPSSEEVQKYEDLLTQLAELDEKMAVIESNPVLVELIMREAKSEDEQRDRVVHAALAEASRQSYGSKRTDPRARDLGEQVAQTFISEVLANSGLDEIKDPAERQRRVYIILSEMFSGVKMANQGSDYGGIARERDLGKQINMFNGVVLLNLLGGCGTLGGTLGLLQRTERGARLGEIEDHTLDHVYRARAVAKHVNSLNLLRAYSQGLKGHRHLDEFVPGFGGWQNDFDTRVTSGGDQGIDAWSSQAIVPRFVSPEEKTRIKERFETEKRKAEDLERTLNQEDEQAKQEAIQAIEDQIAKFEEGIKAYERARVLCKDKDPMYQDIVDREAGIKYHEEEQEKIQTEIERLESELSGLGLFAGRQKRELREEIGRKTERLEWTRSNLPKFREDLETIREALTFMNENKIKYSYDIQNRKYDLTSKLERVKRGY